MKKRLVTLLSYCIAFSVSFSLNSFISWQQCKTYLTPIMMTATKTLYDTMLREQALLGNPEAAQIFMEQIQGRDSQDLFCELSAETVTDMYSKLIASMNVSPAIKSALESALWSAIHKISGRYSKSWF